MTTTDARKRLADDFRAMSQTLVGVASPAEDHDDPVDHPAHYTSHPSGVECIEVTEHMGFNLGNAVKYIWRADEKAGGANALEDLAKARWYIEREIARRTDS